MGSGVSRREWAWAANLPTCFRKSGDLHPEHGTARTRSSGSVWRTTREVLLAPGTTSKLHRQSLALEVTAICSGL